ncbi:hypothetical protein D3C76_851060 [compost metagenome]
MIPSTYTMPVKFIVAVNMNQTDIVRMYWNDAKLTLEYRPRQDKKGMNTLPSVKSRSPVPVELIDVSSNPVVQETRHDKAAQKP